MNSSWLDQLSEIGADSLALTSIEASRPTDTIQFLDRGNLSVVRFSGADVSSFLQAQCCNDHELLSATKAQLNGYCSPKGRLLALPTVVKDTDGDDVFWLLPQDVVESVVKRLTMFVLRSDVTIAVEQDWVVIGLSAPTEKLDGSLAPWFGDKVTPVMSSWSAHGHSVVTLHPAMGQTRTSIFGAMNAVKSSLEKCVAAAKNITDIAWGSASDWTLGDVQAGVPAIVAGTQDAFVPQMVNMQQVDGLSFTKGCYPGQEIVARMQYLGKLKRTMVRFSAEGEINAAAGEKLTAGDDENAGEVVAAASVQGGIELLAVIKTSADINRFVMKGIPLKTHALPYA